MSFGQHTRSIADLLGDLLTQVSNLLRQEGRLARAEISEKIAQAAGAIVLLLAGAILMIPATVILFDAGVQALVDAGLTPALSALVVGGGAFLLGLILVLVGKSRLAPRHLAPSRTVHQLQRDAAIAQEQIGTNPNVRNEHVGANRAA